MFDVDAHGPLQRHPRPQLHGSGLHRRLSYTHERVSWTPDSESFLKSKTVFYILSQFSKSEAGFLSPTRRFRSQCGCSVRCGCTWPAPASSAPSTAGTPHPWTIIPTPFRGTLLMGNNHHVGSCSRPMRRALGWSWGGGRFLISE